MSQIFCLKIFFVPFWCRILERVHSHYPDNYKKERFDRINVGLTEFRSWMEKVYSGTHNTVFLLLFPFY